MLVFAEFFFQILKPFGNLGRLDSKFSTFSAFSTFSTFSTFSAGSRVGFWPKCQTCVHVCVAMSQNVENVEDVENVENVSENFRMRRTD